MWTFLFIVFVIWVIFSLFEFKNKFKKLEVKKEERESFSLLINPFQAITSNKLFGEIHGIKSSIEGKAIPDWSKAESKKFYKQFYEQLRNDILFTKIVYLASDNAYYITNLNHSFSDIVFRNWNTTYLFQKVVAGKENAGIEPYLSYEIYEEIPDAMEDTRKKKWPLKPLVLSVNLVKYPQGEKLNLCEFPLHNLSRHNVSSKENQDYIEKAGFNFDENGWKKNGVYIKLLTSI